MGFQSKKLYEKHRRSAEHKNANAAHRREKDIILAENYKMELIDRYNKKREHDKERYMMMRMASFKQKVAEEKRECPMCGATGKHPKTIKHHMKKEHGVVEWDDLSKDVQERSYAI